MELFLLSTTDIWQSTTSKTHFGIYTSIESALKVAANHELLSYNCKINSMKNLDGHVIIESCPVDSPDLEDFTKVWCTEKTEDYNQLAELTHSIELVADGNIIKVCAKDEDHAYHQPVLDPEIICLIQEHAKNAQLGCFELKTHVMSRTVKLPCQIKWWVVNEPNNSIGTSSKTHYLFGEDAVKALDGEGGVQNILDQEIAHTTYCFEPEKDPKAADLMAFSDGWYDYAIITKEEYDLLNAE